MPGVGDACREKSMADIPKDTRMRSITGARHGSLQPTLCVPTSAQHSCVPQHCLAHHISPPTQAHLSLAATSGHLVLEKMNPTVSIAVILTVLQAAHCQMIRDLSACLLGQSLRVDCRYENKTSNPLTYEFSLTKDNRKHIIQSTISVSENVYRNRANVTMHKNLVCLYLHSFTTSDEGVYMCELKATNDYTGNQIKNITVIKDKLEKCAGFSLLIQNTSWLLLLLLSLPLLQAVDFVSL
uniref:Thy-1 membrane glycoprotein n=2 Tax=Gallus gallus TaxID=9031 RepID=A0A8V1A569_CHICK